MPVVRGVSGMRPRRLQPLDVPIPISADVPGLPGPVVSGVAYHLRLRHKPRHPDNLVTRAIPTCKTCGFQHYNVIACDVAAVQRVITDDEARREHNRSQPIRRARPNDWGDRLETAVPIAYNVTGRQRKPLHSMGRTWTDA